MEKENNIEMILDGMHVSNTDKQFIVIGNIHTHFGKYLVKKYKKDQRIKFIGAVYDPVKTNALKLNSTLYFHGHSVGGTNPSLLEAMASGTMVCAHENVYNKNILGSGGYYFSSSNDVKELIEKEFPSEIIEQKRSLNIEKIKNSFKWIDIITSYEIFITACYNQKMHEEAVIYRGYFR